MTIDSLLRESLKWFNEVDQAMDEAEATSNIFERSAIFERLLTSTDNILASLRTYLGENSDTTELTMIDRQNVAASIHKISEARNVLASRLDEIKTQLSKLN